MHILLSARSTFNQDQRVTVPLRAGDCVIHGQKTLHCSTSNESNVDRYAYILTFVTPPTLLEKPRKAPWLEQRQSIDEQMRRTWMLHGGALRAPGAKNSQAPLAYYIGVWGLSEARSEGFS